MLIKVESKLLSLSELQQIVIKRLFRDLHLLSRLVKGKLFDVAQLVRLSIIKLSSLKDFIDDISNFSLFGAPAFAIFLRFIHRLLLVLARLLIILALVAHYLKNEGRGILPTFNRKLSL